MKATRLVVLLLFGLALQPAQSQWVQTNGPTNGSIILRLAASGPNVVAGTENDGMFLSTDGGANWNLVTNGFPDSVTVTFISALGTTLMAGTGSNVNFFHSTDDGLSWQAGNGIEPIVVTVVAKGSRMFAAKNSNGVYMSSDGGLTWYFENNGLQNTAVQSLAVSGANLFAGTQTNGIYLSTNDGVGWNPVNNGLTSGNIWSFAVIDSTIFAGSYGGGVFRSTNNGTDWIAADSELTNLYVMSLVPTGTNLFAVCYGDSSYNNSIFLSTDSGKIWNAVGAGLGYMNLRCLAVNGPELYVGTDGHGVWKRSMSEVITDVKQNQLHAPSTYLLLQNYPNPFNPSTTISFSIPYLTFSTLKIFNTLGQEIATLVSENLKPGRHSRQWNAANVASGMYFYRLQAGSFVETKKLLLLR